MKKENYIWSAAKIGLIGGAITIYICLIGMMEVFSKRDVIEGIITLGQFILIAASTMVGYIAANRASKLVNSKQPAPVLLAGFVASLLTGIILALFVTAGLQINLRTVFLNASPALYDLLTFKKGLANIWILPGTGAITGLLGAGFLLLPESVRKPVNRALVVFIFMALFSNLFRVTMINVKMESVAKFIFGQSGLTIEGAAIFFFGVLFVGALWNNQGNNVQKQISSLPKSGQTSLRILMFLLLAVVAIGLPQFSGPFIALAIVTVALSIMMALGLNITLGFAGLLDLGFVAFYAVGAYTVGLLTSYGQFGLQHIPFWVAALAGILAAMCFGALLGLPVLGVRGDYLAIATLGFGEIVRLLAGSDFLSPYFGGPQGVIGIQKPCIGTLDAFVKTDVPRVCNPFWTGDFLFWKNFSLGGELSKPQDIYYLAVAGAILIAFIAWRLRESRLGRAWMAIREDEDVAEALGINLIQTKLLAYMLGAAFAGFGGAIFATLIGSIFASSMQLIVSINVVAIVVVGGMGSIPGVILGAVFLIGLPELLREVSEYRYLLYGITLIAMMLSKPEGLLPYKATARELHHAEPSSESEANL
jgi:branched-chain amino acid transport system permease protein